MKECPISDIEPAVDPKSHNPSTPFTLLGTHLGPHFIYIYLPLSCLSKEHVHGSITSFGAEI